jgi:Zn-dependent peptidase ImmA (M78 family)
MNLPTRQPVRWAEAEAKAEALSAPYSAPPIPVHEIAEQNGVNVVIVDFGKHAETVSGLCDFSNSRIYVNIADSNDRKTFTIAHELGHWMLHRKMFIDDPGKYPVLPRFIDPHRGDAVEKEANKFAACLLVPERLLKPVRGTSVSALASIFGVSRTMMEYRLKSSW